MADRFTSTVIWLYIFIAGCQAIAMAETISFEGILDKAIANSYEMKIAETDIKLSQTAVKETRALYFPTLNARVNAEYLKDLTGGTSGMTAIGNTVLSDNSRFQDSVSLNLSYNLWDFGVRGKRRLLAKKGVTQNSLIYYKNLRDLKLRVLDLYTEILLCYNELRARTQIRSTEREILRLKERLYKAGVIGRIEADGQGIRLSRVTEEIEGIKKRLWLVLEDLSSYTQQDYDSETIQPLDFKEEAMDRVDLDEKKSLEYQIYEVEIEKKRAELELLRRQRWPQIGLYSNYTLYGSDSDKFDEAIRDLDKRNWATGVVVNIPLFEGFKSNANGKRLEIELARLELQRSKELNELKNLFARTGKAILSYKQQVESQKGILEDIQDKTVMIERLNSQQIVDKVMLLNQIIELTNQNLEFEKSKINKASAMRKLNILRGSGFGGSVI